MAEFAVDIADKTYAWLEQRAKANGRSLEDEVCAILERAVMGPWRTTLRQPERRAP